MAMARAAVLTGPRKLEMREFPLPEIGPNDGLLCVEANGLCGTDYHQYLCDFKIGTGKLPIIPGHEPIGWIEKIGAEAAKRWKVTEGDRVVLKAPLPCGTCRQCKMGATQRCEKRMGYGLYISTEVAPSLWGGYATHLYLHPNAEMEKASTKIPSDVLTLFNPLSGVVHWLLENSEAPERRTRRHTWPGSARHFGSSGGAIRRRQDHYDFGPTSRRSTTCLGQGAWC